MSRCALQCHDAHHYHYHAHDTTHPPSALPHTRQVVSIDGKETDGWDGDRAAKSLRGRSGSSVTVKFARRSEQVPGVAGVPEQPPRVEYKQVRLRREKVELSPVLSTTVHHEGSTFGYIRLVNFGQHAAQDMAAAIKDLQRMCCGLEVGRLGVGGDGDRH